MKGFSTREAAKKLGVNLVTLQRHIAAKTIKPPPIQKVGGVSIRLWTNRDIERARKFSPALAGEEEENVESGARRCPLVRREISLYTQYNSSR